jgi:hypothetical protein
MVGVQRSRFVGWPSPVHRAPVEQLSAFHGSRGVGQDALRDGRPASGGRNGSPCFAVCSKGGRDGCALPQRLPRIPAAWSALSRKGLGDRGTPSPGMGPHPQTHFLSLSNTSLSFFIAIGVRRADYIYLLFWPTDESRMLLSGIGDCVVCHCLVR